MNPVPFDHVRDGCDIVVAVVVTVIVILAVAKMAKPVQDMKLTASEEPNPIAKQPKHTKKPKTKKPKSKKRNNK